MNLKNKLIKVTLLFTLLFTGCNNQQIQVKNTNIIKKDTQSNSLQLKVKQAFDNAEDLKASHSSWFDREEKLPLTIITTAYIDPKILNTKEYKAYKVLVKKIEKDPSLLGTTIATKYSSIKFVDYNTNSEAKNKFNVAYTNRYNDKEKLTDALRPDIEKPSQELLIRLNYQELLKGNLTIEGYKTVKQANKKRNSYYYTLRKTNYKDLSKKQKNKAIINTLKTTLQLSIPEYVSIDRKKIVKDGEVLRFITPDSDNTYKGVVYSHESGGEIGKLQREIERLEDKKGNVGKEIRTFKGHTSGVNSVAISPDAKFALSGSLDKTLKLWDIKTGKEIRTFKGHTNDVRSVAIGPDGKFALSGSSDKTLKLWDIKTGKEIKTLKGHTSIVKSVAIGPDGKFALSGSLDKTLKLWDIKTGKEIRTFKGHTNAVWSVAISPDGKLALSGSEDDTLKLWDIKTGKEIRTFKGHTSFVISVAIGPDAKYALSGSWDETLKLWDIKTGKEIRTFKGHTHWVRSVAIGPDAKFALSGSIDDTLKLWDINTGKEIRTFKGHTDWVRSVTIGPDGKYALSGSSDKTLKLWGLPFTKIDKKALEVTLPKEIKRLQGFASYREDATKQNILTTSLSEKDFKTLQERYYLTTKTANLKSSVVATITNSLGYDYLDPVVSIAFENTYTNAANSKVLPLQKAFQVQGQSSYDLDELYFTSEYNYAEGGYKTLYEKHNIDLTKAYEITEKEYK